MNGAQAYKTQWKDSFVSIEHLLVALSKDTRYDENLEYISTDSYQVRKTIGFFVFGLTQCTHAERQQSSIISKIRGEASIGFYETKGVKCSI